jgi:nucleotide-binding universal stress UspA family protein
MPFKALLTHVADDRSCASRLRMTAGVARVLGAEIIGLGARAPWPYATNGGRGDAFEAILEDARRSLETARRQFQDQLGDPAIAKSWRSEVGYPDDVMASHARAADLILSYPTRGEVDRTLYATPDTLVMETGLPVLLMPSKEAQFRADTILLAWKNTRESRRAISVTLPLLAGAKRVLVAAVCGAAEIGPVEQELADVVQRLARHGVNATSLAEAGAPGAAGGKLLRIAETDKSDLIVAGAYGHSRLREWVLGGVTRDLLADGRRFVLLSH